MGSAEYIPSNNLLLIRSIFYFYGEAASPELSVQIADDIKRHWNEPRATVQLKRSMVPVRFEVQGIYAPDLDPEMVWYNDNPQLNFFRIEKDVMGNISFVDGIGCNTGYFKLDNLLQTSTTAAHEYGHTIGLVHPEILDLRGEPIPGVMYPRGTLCDPHFQYDPTVAAGEYGGVLNPIHRKVLQSDIDLLRLHKLDFDAKGFATLGEFSSIYHEKHILPEF